MKEAALQFPAMALGTWTFAGDAIWSESSENESISVIHAALDMGITLFDTSPNYGNGRSESILGRALANRPAAAVATKTKIGGRSRESIRQTIEESLARLQREAIDLMQIHWPGSSPEETASALDLFMEMKREGKIVNIGACNFGVHDLRETEKYPIISNQLPYNLMWRVVEKEIAPLSKALGKRVWAYSPLQQGLLTGKYASLHDFPEGRKRTRHFSSEHEAAMHGEQGMEAETQAALTAFLKLSEETGIPPMKLGLSYIMSHPFIDTVLVGARTVSQLEELVASTEGTPDPGLIETLDSISQPLLEATGGNPDMYQPVSRVRY